MSSTWVEVPLGDVAKLVARPVEVVAGQSYRTIGVKWWGEGAYERQTIDGSRTSAKTLSLVREGDLIINKIWVRHGSTAIASSDVDGCAASNEFPTFALDKTRILPQWIHWQTKTRSFWIKCDALSRGTSGKNRIRPELFLTIRVPLPPLSEQRRIVARIEELAVKITEARELRAKQRLQIQQQMVSTFYKISRTAPRMRMGDIAPIVRRPVDLDLEASYPELGIRSFGKGTFHKPVLSGSEVGTKTIFKIEPGDLIFSNVFAWEGAIAVARPQDSGRFGSHRFITCIPKNETVTSNFLCFYFLTDEGLDFIRAASPGGAGRNRTLGLQALANISVPVPTLAAQQWFDEVLTKVDTLRKIQAETAAELDALLPSILDRALKGQL